MHIYIYICMHIYIYIYKYHIMYRYIMQRHMHTPSKFANIIIRRFIFFWNSDICMIFMWGRSKVG